MTKQHQNFAETRELLAQLSADERKALWLGVGFQQHPRLVELGLVKPAYRTNRKGERRFCGRRTPKGYAIVRALDLQEDAP